MIRGWAGLKEATNISGPMLVTLVRVRDFPKPKRFHNKHNCLYWDEGEVYEWLRQNPKRGKKK